MANVINWFEIPAQNFERAMKFYGELFGEELQLMEMEGIKMGIFPNQNEGVGGAICAGEWYQPSENGAVVYLNGGEDLAVPLKRAVDAGGSVLVPKTLITEEIGYFAMFRDCEGNRVAFHSPN